MVKGMSGFKRVWGVGEIAEGWDCVCLNVAKSAWRKGQVVEDGKRGGCPVHVGTWLPSCLFVIGSGEDELEAAVWDGFCAWHVFWAGLKDP